MLLKALFLLPALACATPKRSAHQDWRAVLAEFRLVLEDHLV